jgi:hypothetical protein
MQCLTFTNSGQPAVLAQHLYYPGDAGDSHFGSEPFIFP